MAAAAPVTGRRRGDHKRRPRLNDVRLLALLGLEFRSDPCQVRPQVHAILALVAARVEDTYPRWALLPKLRIMFCEILRPQLVRRELLRVRHTGVRHPTRFAREALGGRRGSRHAVEATTGAPTGKKRPSLAHTTPSINNFNDNYNNTCNCNSKNNKNNNDNNNNDLFRTLMKSKDKN